MFFFLQLYYQRKIHCIEKYTYDETRTVDFREKERWGWGRWFYNIPFFPVENSTSMSYSWKTHLMFFPVFPWAIAITEENLPSYSRSLSDYHKKNKILLSLNKIIKRLNDPPAKVMALEQFSEIDSVTTQHYNLALSFRVRALVLSSFLHFW